MILAAQDQVVPLGVYNTPWDNLLFAYIYRAIARGDRGVQGLITHDRFDRIRPLVSHLNGIQKEKAITIQACFLRHRGVLREVSKESGLIADSLLDTMHFCRPAGIRLNILSRLSCKKYSICPHCRYRLGYKIFRKLQYRMAAYDRISCLRFHTHYSLLELDKLRDELASIKRAVRIICKSRRTWQRDAVVTVPVYHERLEQWVLRTTVIAIRRSADPLPEPDGFKLFRDSAKWQDKKLSTASLARAVAGSVAFSPQLYHQATTDEFDIVAMRELTQHLRTAFHGFARQRNGETAVQHIQRRLSANRPSTLVVNPSISDRSITSQ